MKTEHKPAPTAAKPKVAAPTVPLFAAHVPAQHDKADKSSSGKSGNLLLIVILALILIGLISVFIF